MIDIKKPNIINLVKRIAVKYRAGYSDGDIVPRKIWGEYRNASPYDFTSRGSS